MAVREATVLPPAEAVAVVPGAQVETEVEAEAEAELHQLGKTEELAMLVRHLEVGAPQLPVHREVVF